MFVTISLILGLLIVIYYYLIWNYDHWNKRGLPGPKPLPFFGNLPNAVTQRKNKAYDFHKIYQKYKGKYPFVGIFNMRQPQVMILDPENVKDVLIRNFKNFHDSEFSNLINKEKDPIFGRNPMFLKGEEWKEKRSEVTPLFTTTRIKTLFPLIEDVCQRMTKFIKEEIEKKSPEGIDTRELTAKYTTDVVSSCIFAVDAKSFTDSNAKIREIGREMFSQSFVFFFYIAVVTIAPFVKFFYEMPFVAKSKEKFFTSLIGDAIAYRLNNKIDRDDCLHYMLQLREKKNLSDLDLAALCITFFTDGFETSSVTMAHILYELAKHKNVQDKLRNEIKDTITKYGSINYENVTEMPYLDQVFYESLRLHPPVTLTTRLCTEECKLKLNEKDEVAIEKGIIAMIPFYSIQRDPEYYSDAEKFIPERFDPENGGVKAFREKGVFMPFGDGPRICLGMRFAMAQVKTGIVELVRKFELSVNSKTQEPLVLDPKRFVSVPIGGLWLDFKVL